MARQMKLPGRKPDLIVYAVSLNGHWARCGVAWRNKTKDKNPVGYLKISLDFMPPSGELTVWNANDRPNDLEPEEKQEEKPDGEAQA
jgi:hypothetical protein